MNGIEDGYNKSTKAIEKIITSTVQSSRTLITATGRKIRLTTEQAAYLGIGVLSGFTAGSIWQKLHQNQKMMVKQFEEQKEVNRRYREIAESGFEEFNIDDWRAMVATISANLETQIRFQLGLDDDTNCGLNELLLEMEKEKLCSMQDLRNLHKFKKIRNKVLHNSNFTNIDPKVILWTSNYVENF